MSQIPFVNVEIRRGKEHIHVVVPRHEVRVLRAVHRQEHVSELGESRKRYPLPETAGEEFARLSRKYQSKDSNPVLLAYPGGPEQLEGLGFASGAVVPISGNAQAAGVYDHEEAEEPQVGRGRRRASADAE